MKKLLISHSLLAQMIAVSLNKKYDYVCHLRYIDKNCNEQRVLSEVNRKENERLSILEAFGNDVSYFIIRDRELQQLKEIVKKESIEEITFITLNDGKKSKENFKKLQNMFTIQKIIWLTIH